MKAKDTHPALTWRTRKVKLTTWGILGIILLGMFGVFEHIWWAVRPAPIPYTMYESEVNSGDFRSPAEVYWVDDDTLLFEGYAQPNISRGEDPTLRYRLFLWRLGKEAEVLMRFPERAYQYEDFPADYPYPSNTFWDGRYCAADGNLKIGNGNRTSEDGKKYWYYLYGPPGALEVNKTVHGIYAHLHATGSEYRQFTCSGIAIPEMQYRHWRALRDEHGYIDFGPTNQTNSIKQANFKGVYYPFGEGRITTSIPSGNANDVYYLPWRNAYFFEAIGGRAPSKTPKNLKGTRCHVYWIMELDGSAVGDCFPIGKWDQADVYPAMTKLGLVFGAVKSGADGLYLKQGSKAIHLLKGRIENVTVSPNGCRVAFNYVQRWQHTRKGSDIRSRRIRVVDLCQDDNR